MQSIDGEQVPIEQLERLHNEEEIKKVLCDHSKLYSHWCSNLSCLSLQFYKVSPEEREISSLENSVVTRMVVRDVT